MIRVEKYKMEPCEDFVLKQIRKFKCRSFMDPDGIPWIADMKCIGNGEVAVIDKWNSKLKVYNYEYKHRVTLKIPGGRSMIFTQHNVIIVSDEGPLRLYSVDKGLTDVTNEQNSVEIKNENATLATNGNDVAVLRYDDALKRGCIQVFSLDQQLRFMHKSLIDITEQFDVSRYFAYDEENGNFYLGDILHNYLVAISSLSEILWKVKLTSWPRGIVLVEGFIFVATHFDNIVHCVTRTGEHMGTVLNEKDGIFFPLALSYDKHRKRLIVQCNYSGDMLVFNVSLRNDVHITENHLNLSN